MDFEFTDDQLDLQASARSILASACPPALVRRVFEGGTAPELWETLVGLDWPALGLPEEVGGLGLGFLEVGIVVEELGRVVAPTPYLATATQLVPALTEAGSTLRLADVAAGTCTGTLAVAEDGCGWRPESIGATARPIGGGRWRLDGSKAHVCDGATADEIAVVVRAEGTRGWDGLGLFAVPAGTPGLTTSSPPVIDPTLPAAALHQDGVEVEGDRVLLEPGDPAAPTAIRRAVEAATAAMALTTVATSRAVVEQTLQYAKDREQFGRPIGSFQALKHRLADMYLAVERASALGYFAALTIAEDDERRTVAVSMAKAAAGDCQRLVVGDGLQLHGGIGFTWEHDLHFGLKRAKAGDLLFGNAAFHRARLAVLLGLDPAGDPAGDPAPDPGPVGALA
jgi:alkylation response protein AidB-like acyl-CoA dehydrogenase